MNLEELKHQSDSWWNNLNIRVAFTNGNEPVGLPLEMPSDCSPHDVVLAMMAKSRDAPGKPHGFTLDYCLCFEDGFKYEGNNSSLKKASTGDPIVFTKWFDVAVFLKSLSDDGSGDHDWDSDDATDDTLSGPEIVHVPRRPDPDKPKRPELSSVPDVDVNTVTDFSAVKVEPNFEGQMSYKVLRKELGKTIMDQDIALDTIAYQTAAFLKKPRPRKPVSFLAFGKPGTGKSEAAKVLGRILGKRTDHPFSVVWTDLNTFTESHTVYRLIGSPAGYVGYDDPPLFDEVVKNPYTLFIFDELDKAHPQVLKIFMAILDEGRCASNKELSDHTRVYNFQHCIFFFTSNYDLSGNSHKIGFSMPDEIEKISIKDNAITIQYQKNKPGIALTQSIYAQNERARQAFIGSGHLPEVASRIGSFVEFKPLSDNAKIRILAKQIVESGFEYGVRLTYIAPGIMQELASAAVAENSLTVRSFRPVIEGYLAEAFAATGALPGADDEAYKLEGTLDKPVLKKVGKQA